MVKVLDVIIFIPFLLVEQSVQASAGADG